MNCRCLCHTLVAGLLLVLALSGCHRTDGDASKAVMLLRNGSFPQAVYWKGTYYVMAETLSGDSVIIRATKDLANLATARKRVVLVAIPKKFQNIWSPELHRIGDKWYLYFEADDGNTDNHQLYVFENSSDDPMQGDFVLHGPIVTDGDWNYGVHPSTVVVKGTQYLVWSGWLRRRMETETQCIFIARMANPWTLGSERVMLSQPEYEWERQWINPDGTCSAYPIYVNENPEPFVSRDGRKVMIYYSASGVWTVYNALGMLCADADSDLLDPASWTKAKEPLFVCDSTQQTCYGTSNIYIVPDKDKQTDLILYERKELADKNVVNRDILMQPVGRGKDGLPDLGSPSCHPFP